MTARDATAGGSDPASSSHAAIRIAVAGAIATLAVPFAAYTGFVLYHFYTRGSFVLDAGLEAFLASHGGLTLPYPASLGGGSYLRSHVVPVFMLTSLLRRAFPVADAQFFAGFIGLTQALPALGVFWMLRAGFGLRSAAAAMLAALIGIAFAFNGTALAIARYPHFEMLIVGAAMLFVVALIQRRLLLAGLCFTAALATREDAGFHLFGLLFVLVALNRCYRLPWRAQRPEIAFAVAGFAYSAVVLACQAVLSDHPSALATTYIASSGAGVSLTTIAGRIVGYLDYRAYVVLPALVAVVWAIRTRNPYILVGYAAFVPWGLLQLVARSDIAGTLSGYYAFPFMIAAFWPLAGIVLDRRGRAVSAGAAEPIAWFCAMIAVSFIGVAQQYNPGRLDLVTAFLSPPSAARQAKTQRAVAAFVTAKPALGTVLADTSVVALLPDDFTPGETVQDRGPVPPDAVVYFAQGYDAPKLRALAAAPRLRWRYLVPGTSLRLAADRPIAASPLAALLTPAGVSE